MPQSDQGISKDRYTVIPRTAIFLRRRDSYLLLKGSPTQRLWAYKYNGLGGHIERGENALTSAKRELLEETGLNSDAPSLERTKLAESCRLPVRHLAEQSSGSLPLDKAGSQCIVYLD